MPILEWKFSLNKIDFSKLFPVIWVNIGKTKYADAAVNT